jgi:hypothetical protein
MRVDAIAAAGQLISELEAHTDDLALAGNGITTCTSDPCAPTVNCQPGPTGA